MKKMFKLGLVALTLATGNTFASNWCDAPSGGCKQGCKLECTTFAGVRTCTCVLKIKTNKKEVSSVDDVLNTVFEYSK